MYEKAAKAAKTGNYILSIAAAILIILMLLYGGYSLWDTYRIYHNGFTDEELLTLKPAEKENGSDFIELRRKIPNTCAWLTIDDTHIDYPVMQGKDDMEYINKNVYGDYSVSGAIFLSCLNKADFSDSYNLVYGHNMKNGAMFGDIVKFANQKYFEKHKTGTLCLPEKTYKIKLFACIRVNASDAMIYEPENYEKDSRDSLLKYIKEHAVRYREMKITSEESLIAFSTCAESETNGRVVLVGKLVEKRK